MRALWVLGLVACSSSTPRPEPRRVDPVPDASIVTAAIDAPVREPDPQPSACPATAAEAKGSCLAGNINRECPYPPSTVCSCTTDAPPCSPVNHDNDPTIWVCTGPPPPPVPPKPRTDGCPATPPQGACNKPNKQCSYKAGCCSELFTCSAGAWTYIMACPK